MDLSTREAITYVVIALCFLGQAAVVNWTICYNLAMHSLRKCCLFVASLRRAAAAAEDDEDLGADATPCGAEDEELQRRVLAWQLWFFQKHLIACQACLGLFTLSVLLSSLSGVELVRTWLQDCVFLGSYLVILLLQKVHSCLDGAGWSSWKFTLLGVFYSVHILSLSLFSWGSVQSWLVETDFILVAVRTCVVLWVVQKRWIILGSFVYSSVYLVRVYTSDTTLFFPALVRQFVFAGFLLISSDVCRRSIVMQVRATHEAQTMRDATERLLGLFCDAVAHVDGELRFLSDAAKLAGTIFLGERHDLRGTGLEDLLEVDDVQEVRRILASAAGYAEPTAGAFNTRMRDSLGNLFTLEVFYIHFLDIGRHRYLLGFRECVESCRQAGGAALRAPTISPPLLLLGYSPSNQATPPTTIGLIDSSGGQVDSSGEQVDSSRGQIDSSRGANEDSSHELNVSSAENSSENQAESAESAESVESADNASSSEYTETAVKFIFPSRRPTLPHLVQGCLMDICKSFNYPKPVLDPCCLYHGALEALASELDHLNKQRCQSTFMLHTQWQCQACGIMQSNAPADDFCCFCHEPVAAPPASSSATTTPAWAAGLDRRPEPKAVVGLAQTTEL
eukprot:TRINITY_DN27288_c0_g1_i1.p1 TRINITY_DN27288_c0_g1~~TRINITY_DN27288_c0_g1_i1.p1  ORF type:complete len:622 (+),score=95.67 TRINITY_DN27288_c0_g1_i1:96-1961(+)